MGAMLLCVYDVRSDIFLGDWEWSGGYVIRLMGRQGKATHGIR
jgi:hypothetical protein